MLNRYFQLTGLSSLGSSGVIIQPEDVADAGIALGVLVVGHGRPGEVHDVGADDRGL